MCERLFLLACGVVLMFAVLFLREGVLIWSFREVLCTEVHAKRREEVWRKEGSVILK